MAAEYANYPEFYRVKAWVPTLLDLFCGAGGAAMGYHKAGFDKIIGIDNKQQLNYPFDGVLMDALDALKSKNLSKVDLIHASPPCQFYSVSSFMYDRGYPDLIEPVRNLLIETGRPYIIENVPGAPLINPIKICGSGLGMTRIRRHRLFESNFPLVGTKCNHAILVEPLSVAGHNESNYKYATRRLPHNLYARRQAMGINWMDRYEITQAIPPAYTEYLGRQFLEGR